MRRILGMLTALCLLAGGVDHCLGATDSMEILKVEGTVRVRDAAGRSLEGARAGMRVPRGGSVETGETGRAVVRLDGAGVAVVAPRSQLAAPKAAGPLRVLRQFSGWIYYAFRRDPARREPLQVRTTVATIGVRGTRFLVAVGPDRNEVSMRKGEVSVESIGAEFELHRRMEEDEFEAYRREIESGLERQQQQFRRYVDEQSREFVEYLRTFALPAGRQATFDGRRVSEAALSESARTEMDAAEAYAASWLETVQD